MNTIYQSPLKSLAFFPWLSYIEFTTTTPPLLSVILQARLWSIARLHTIQHRVSEPNRKHALS
jgi:hypothetical protein